METANQQNKTSEAFDQTIIIEEKITKSNGDILIKRYGRGKMLGKGGFAKCYETTNLETKRVHAAKIILKSSLTKSRAKQKLFSEIKIHKWLHHANIVNFEHVFEDSEAVYILLELCSNQTLNELIKRRKCLTELEVQCYLIQIISALKYMHSNRVIHRDLKLGNLFLSDKMEIKIGDFGLATRLEFDGEKKCTICGTPNYIAPEVLDGKIGHSYEVDIWSLGVICYTLLIGKPPFETPDVNTTYKKIKMGSYSFPDHIPISDAAKSLITQILNLDPARRPTLDEILQHPFINHGGTIPSLLPVSTLACPPSASYLRQYLPQANSMNGWPGFSKMMEGTSPIDENAIAKFPQNQRNNLISTQATPFTNKDNQSNPNPSYNQSQAPNSLNNYGFIKDSTGTITKDSKTSDNTKTLGIVNAGGQMTQKITKASEIWVKKWVDYSSKYGLGYLLSNGATGVFFNDSSKIVLDPRGMTFEYIERRASDKVDVVTVHMLTDYPKELQKKVTLLHHFKSYLEGAGKADILGSQYTDEELKNIGTVYVKKWMKTKHAIMFRLSNKLVQVNFTDKTEIILSSENKTVTYVNKKGERSNYPLAYAMDSSNAEMAKRLKYTKEILTHMLNANTQAHTHTNPEGNVQTGNAH